MNEGAKDTFGTAAARRVPRIAVLVPCYNEAVTIAKVVDDFRRRPAGCRRCTYTTTTPRTAPVPSRASMGPPYARSGAKARATSCARCCATWTPTTTSWWTATTPIPAEAAPALLAPARGRRGRHDAWATACQTARTAKRTTAPSMVSGTISCAWLIKRIYGFEFKDVMTGYRAFNAVFAKTMPVLAPGFEIETELSIHAVDKRWRIAEVPIDYRDRPAGSVSQARPRSPTERKVLLTILSLFKDYRPLVLFSWLALLFCVLGLVRRRARGGGVHADGIGPEAAERPSGRGARVRGRALLRLRAHPGHGGQRARARSTSWRSPAPTSDMRAAEVRGKAESDKGRMGDAPPLY